MTKLPEVVALEKAKIALMSSPDAVFFTVICFSLKAAWITTIPTAATDGRSLYLNPEFFLDLTTPERVFVLLHETLHCAFMHITRRGTKDPTRWNYAADYAINGLLVARGFKMPSGGLHDLQYANLSVEQIYALLPEMPADPRLMDILAPKSIEGTDTPAQSAKALEDDMSDILIRASIMAKAAGNTAGSIPGDIQIFLDRLLNPRFPWHRILARYINTWTKHDYSLKRPNRRFFPTHYLPSRTSESLMDLVICVDTSGSVSDAEFKGFIGETASVFKMMRPEKITLIQFDTTIKEVTPIKSIRDLMAVRFRGRGGTSIDPVFEWINTNKPQLVLLFTDGDFNQHSEVTCKTNLLWIIHNNPGFKTKTGKVIHYEVAT
jgi:predicted metal-dependent peptidase